MDFYQRYLSLCIEKGESPTAAAKAIGLSNAAPSGWKKGAVPNDSTIVKLSRYFGVPSWYLRGTGPSPAKPISQPIDEEEQAETAQEEDYDEFLELLKSDPDSRAILKSYGAGNRDERQMITRMIKAIKGKDGE